MELLEHVRAALPGSPCYHVDQQFAHDVVLLAKVGLDLLALHLEDGHIDQVRDQVLQLVLDFLHLEDFRLQLVHVHRLVVHLDSPSLVVRVHLEDFLELVEHVHVLLEGLDSQLESLAEALDQLPKPLILVRELQRSLIHVGRVRAFLRLHGRLDVSLVLLGLVQVLKDFGFEVRDLRNLVQGFLEEIDDHVDEVEGRGRVDEAFVILGFEHLDGE